LRTVEKDAAVWRRKVVGKRDFETRAVPKEEARKNKNIRGALIFTGLMEEL
jgi:hypothetical protein